MSYKFLKFTRCRLYDEVVNNSSYNLYLRVNILLHPHTSKNKLKIQPQDPCAWLMPKTVCFLCLNWVQELGLYFPKTVFLPKLYFEHKKAFSKVSN